jgi:hypothetical protein
MKDTNTNQTKIWVHFCPTAHSGDFEIHKVGCRAVLKVQRREYDVTELPLDATVEDIVDTAYGLRQGSFIWDAGCETIAEYIDQTWTDISPVRVHACAKDQGFKLRRAAAEVK